MKKQLLQKWLLPALLFLAQGTWAQNVNVSPGAGSYATLKNAFDAINAGTHTGTISISIVNSTTETASAVLNASGTGSASYSSISIQPGGSGISVSGSITGNLIDFNGADNVTITGGNNLTISNTATGASNTIRFINDATNNTIATTRLEGSASTLQYAVVNFSTGTTSGNDNNMISQCDITAAGTNLPINGIFSLGTANIDNSNNTVTGCNIYDFFSAGSTSIGIHINATNALSSSAWTISNNKFYQTATRTYTTANTHQAIFIGVGTGYTISGNTIGYATSSATGVYTMAGTIATRFVGIGLSLTAGAPATSVQGNTISGIQLNTSSGATTQNGILCGINIVSGDVNVGTVTPNIIGGSTGTQLLKAIPTTANGMTVGINSQGTGNIFIQNNIIGGLFSSGTTAAVSGYVTGIMISGVATTLNISNNTIGNADADNMQGGTLGLTTGSPIVAGIGLVSFPLSITVSGNTIRNLSAYGTGTSSSVRGIYTAGATGNVGTGSIINNVIMDLKSNGALASLTNGICSALGINCGIGANMLISGNSISNIANINTTATTNIIVAGLTLANSTNTLAVKNKIWNLSNSTVGTTATTPPVIAGIALRSGTTGVTVANNMVSLGSGLTSNTAVIGIWSNHGSTPDPAVNLFHNSIHINGTNTGALPSFGYVRGDLGATARTVAVNIKNNIFDNQRTGGTGGHYAIANNYGATVTTTGWPAGASDYNVLNASDPNNVAHWTTAQTFAGWQTASASDVASQTAAAVNFTNTATGDLHVSLPTPIEGAGTFISSITDDYDGQTRSAFSPVDVGADAGNFISYPIISFTPLANTCTGGTRTLSADISDVDGVPTSGSGLPVLYWKINGGSYTASPGTYVSGTQYNFTLGTGSVINDVISYYIVAQDNLGTVGASPAFGASGFSINPPAASTPPTGPFSYVHAPTLNGTYTVGATGDYATLTQAVNSYNIACLAGPVTFSLIDASYPSETFPININHNSQASATNTLTIKPAVATSFTGSAATLITINGGDFVTIDGSTGNTPNTLCPLSSATRDLTFTNNTALTASGVIWLGNAADGNPATNCAVKNCILIGASSSTCIFGIGAGGNALGSGGIDIDNMSFVNNDVRKVRVGIYTAGQSPTNKNENLTINQNVMNSAAPNSIGETGIYAAYVNNATVSGNVVDNIIRTTSPDGVGINLGMGAVNGIATTTTGIADAIGNATISQNKIGVISNSGTFSSAGITLGNTVSGTQLIANNLITGVIANGTSTDFATGIHLGGGTGNTSVINNTVVMQGLQPGTSAGTTTSTALSVVAIANPLEVKNNILINTQGGGVAGTTTRYLAMALGYAMPLTGLTSNNNDLWVAGAGPGTYFTGSTGTIVAGTTSTTLTDWITNTTRDANSVSVTPNFVSSTDYHLTGANTGISNGGTPVASVTTDLDCAPRSTPPDMGAYEMLCSGGTVQLITSNTTMTTTANSCEDGNWTYYTDPTDATKTLFGINWGTTNSAAKASATVTLNLDAANGSASQTTPTIAGTFTMKRYWNVDITSALVNPVSVRFFYTASEKAAVDADAATFSAANGNAPIETSTWFKTTSGAFNPATGLVPSKVLNAIALTDGNTSAATIGGVLYAQFDGVTSFSGGTYASGVGNGTPLPIELLSFTGKNLGSTHQLDWSLNTDATTGRADLEQSADGKTFQSIYNYEVAGNNGVHRRSYTNDKLFAGMNYYRLKVQDANGRSSYSPIVSLLHSTAKLELLSLSPNPVANGRFALQMMTQEALPMQLCITDATGRIVAKQSIQTQAGNNTIEMNVSQLAAGVYAIYGISDQGKTKVIPFVKQ